MRISVKKDDEGYSQEAYKYKAFCNGVELKHCHTADEELGIAICYSDTLFLSWMTELPEEILHGKIEIIKQED